MRPRLTYRRRSARAYEQRTVELDDAGLFHVELGSDVALTVSLAAARLAAHHDPMDFHLEEPEVGPGVVAFHCAGRCRP